MSRAVPRLGCLCTCVVIVFVGLCALEKVCVHSSRLVYVDKCVLPTVLGKNLSELLNPKQRETRGAYLLELNVGHYKMLNMKDSILNTK